jgi:hypothetical protein
MKLEIHIVIKDLAIEDLERVKDQIMAFVQTMQNEQEIVVSALPEVSNVSENTDILPN